MKKRILKNKTAVLGFNSQVLLFNNEALTFWVRGLPHFDVEGFTYTEQDMGEATITCDMFVEPNLIPAFDKDWYVDFRGEEYTLTTLAPACVKDNSSMRYKYTLIFKSSRADLDRYEFANYVSADGAQQPISYDFVLVATIQEFVTRFNINLDYYFGSGVWNMVLDPSYAENLNTAIYDGTSTVTTALTRETLWSLLTGLYDIYGLRWKITSIGGVMTITLGYTPITLAHTFQYGYANGLVSVERANSQPDIYTRISGKGSNRNMPYRYFNTSTADYIEDPDNNTFTQLIPYSGLMPKSYRDYIKGWNDTSIAVETYAYLRGVADASAGASFNPVDYVISEEAEAIYGVRKGSIETNEDIYPTFQNTTIGGLGRLDEVIFVEEVLNDDYLLVDSSISVKVAIPVTSSQKVTGTPALITPLKTAEFDTTSTRELIKTKFSFSTPESYWSTNVIVSATATLMNDTSVVNTSTSIIYGNHAGWTFAWDIEFLAPDVSTYYIQVDASVYDASFGGVRYLPFNLGDTTINFSGYYSPTFDIWIKNIWNSTFQDGGYEDETEDAYMHRIWDPLFTPAEKMAVMFSDGLLAGEDYVFEVAVPDSSTAYCIYHDETKSYGGIYSHWRISLLKSDAMLESNKIKLPNIVQNASTGDHMFFTGIEMPYYPYVYDAEERLDEYLQNELAKVDSENPTYIIKPSNVFLETYAENASIGIGVKVNITDSQIFGVAPVGLFISTLSIEYRKDKMLPEWGITVIDKPASNKNVVSILQGDVKVLSSNQNSAAEITEQINLQLDNRYLRRDGEDTISYSKTTFKNSIITEGSQTSNDFLEGKMSGLGYSIYKDSNGNYVLEIDKLNIRKTLYVNELVINQVSIYGGVHIYSAAAMTVLNVEYANSNYTCYLDVKNGTVLNQFVVGDLAFCQRCDPESNAVIKEYWREIIEVGYDYITFTDYGIDDPPSVGDNIAQLGNTSNADRQCALIIDQTNGGSVTQYAGIDNYSLVDKDFVQYGYDPSTGRAYETIYGDMYIGGRNPATDHYLKFDSSTGRISYRGIITQDSTVIDADDNEFAITVDRGVYDAGAIYYVGNTVYSAGSTYYCYVNTSVGDAPTDTAHWRIHAAAGANGTSVKIVGSYATASNLPAPYDNEAFYDPGVTVAYNGGLYQSINITLGGNLPTDTGYWEYLNISNGDGYITLDTGHLWVLNGTAWIDAGQIKGDTGKGISTVTIKYLATDASSGVDTSTAGWQTTMQTMTPTNKYLWSYQIITYTDTTSLTTTPIIIGVYGDTGTTLYTWIKYADTSIGGGLSDSPTGKLYIGLAYNKTTATESETASYYSWSLIKGDTGNTGATGAAGANGVTTYTWIKYADVSDGTGLYDTPTTGTLYIGIAVNKTTAVESITKTDYMWSKFRGDTGVTGATGATGAGGVAIVCDKQNLSVIPDINAFTAAVTIKLSKGSSFIPKAEWTSVTKTPINVSCGTDTSTSDSYIVNLTGFTAETIAVGYVSVDIVYAGTTYTISISVARNSTPVYIQRGDYVAGTVYTGNYILREEIKYTDGNWYAAKPTVGDTSTGWVLSQWELLNNFKNIATETLLTENANIAGFVYKDEQMISQSGTIAGNPSTNWGAPSFVPNLMLDGSTGEVIARNATIHGDLYAAGDKFKALNDGTFELEFSTDISRYDSSGNTETVTQTVTINNTTGTIETKTSDNDTAYMTSQGVFANKAGIQAIPSVSGIELKASIVGLGQGDLAGSAYAGLGVLCGVYGDVNNSNANPATSYGGYFNKLKANGLYLTTKLVQDPYVCTDYEVFISCYNTSTITVTLPPLPYAGKIIYVRRNNPSGVNVDGNGAEMLLPSGSVVASRAIASQGEVYTFLFDGFYWLIN